MGPRVNLYSICISTLHAYSMQHNYIFIQNTHFYLLVPSHSYPKERILKLLLIVLEYHVLGKLLENTVERGRLRRETKGRGDREGARKGGRKGMVGGELSCDQMLLSKITMIQY